MIAILCVTFLHPLLHLLLFFVRIPNKSVTFAKNPRTKKVLFHTKENLYMDALQLSSDDHDSDYVSPFFLFTKKIGTSKNVMNEQRKENTTWESERVIQTTCHYHCTIIITTTSSTLTTHKTFPLSFQPTVNWQSLIQWYSHSLIASLSKRIRFKTKPLLHSTKSTLHYVSICLHIQWQCQTEG